MRKTTIFRGKKKKKEKDYIGLRGALLFLETYNLYPNVSKPIISMLLLSHWVSGSDPLLPPCPTFQACYGNIGSHVFPQGCREL